MGFLALGFHLLAAIVWIGGMLFLVLVLTPSLRSLDDPGLRSRIVRLVGRRFRTVGWIAIGVLIVTGILNVVRLGISPIALPGTRFGTILGLKLALVSLMVVLSAIHGFILGPRLTSSNPAPGGPGSEGAGTGFSAASAGSWSRRRVAERGTVVTLARLNLLLGIAIVLLGLMLTRG